MEYKKYLFALLLAALFFGAGYYVGFGSQQSFLNLELASIHPLRINDTHYKFINPLLLYIVPYADQEGSLLKMKNRVQDVINAAKKTEVLSDASVFFQDLNRGQRLGVNQDSQYSPASMLKVVIMVSYYKKAESLTGFLNQSLLYTQDVENAVKSDPYNQLSSLIVGKKYVVEDLIEKMIVDSDNGATLLLLDHIDRPSLNSVYSALNIQSPDEMEGDFTISSRHYSFFFRILYSATYLNDVNSEKALNTLSRAVFDDGIVAGIPDTITVAHKYGERVIQSGQVRQSELHDCGIVYYPQNPYLLCIMTRGNDLEKLKNTIKDISSIVYQDYSFIK